MSEGFHIKNLYFIETVADCEGRFSLLIIVILSIFQLTISGGFLFLEETSPHSLWPMFFISYFIRMIFLGIQYYLTKNGMNLLLLLLACDSVLQSALGTQCLFIRHTVYQVRVLQLEEPEYFWGRPMGRLEREAGNERLIRL
ncbi:hypothetical protein CAEBREN_24933 [Caenorhabditis brenneri]|uniref:Uncharacterized protein n=1 Tax=Caenorhabditis brenneri TaxID=135651 RepID=G0NJ82_CAEBE|nr:hypothetical protein CAEBREN_24933 [Caenorhabditis brenneri]